MTFPFVMPAMGRGKAGVAPAVFVASFATAPTPSGTFTFTFPGCAAGQLAVIIWTRSTPNAPPAGWVVLPVTTMGGGAQIVVHYKLLTAADVTNGVTMTYGAGNGTAQVLVYSGPTTVALVSSAALATIPGYTPSPNAMGIVSCMAGDGGGSSMAPPAGWTRRIAPYVNSAGTIYTSCADISPASYGGGAVAWTGAAGNTGGQLLELAAPTFATVLGAGFDPGLATHNWTISADRLTATKAGGPNWSTTVGYPAKSTGKFYFEVKFAFTAGAANEVGVGIAGRGSFVLAGNYIGLAAHSVGLRGNGFSLNDNAYTVPPANGVADLTIVSTDSYFVAVDVDARKLWVKKSTGQMWNADVIANQNPATGAGGWVLSGTDPIAIAATLYSTAGDSATLNLGATAFLGAPPAGFVAWGVAAGNVAPTPYTALDNAANQAFCDAGTTNNAPDGTVAHKTVTGIGECAALPGKPATAGKLYFEAVFNTQNNTSGGCSLGVLRQQAQTNSTLATYIGGTPYGTGCSNNGAVVQDATTLISAAADLTFGDNVPLFVAVDIAGGLVWFKKAGGANWNNSSTADPTAGTGGIALNGTGPICAALAMSSINRDFGAISMGAFGVFANPRPVAGFEPWDTPVTARPSSATWDPAQLGPGLTLSNVQQAALASGSNQTMVRSTLPQSAGKWYAEFYLNASGVTVGLDNGLSPLTDILGQNANSLSIDFNGEVRVANGALSAVIPGMDLRTNGLQVAVDIGAKRLYLRQVGAAAWSGPGGAAADPVAGTGGFDFSAIAGPNFYLAARPFGAGSYAAVATGLANALAGVPPAGYRAWGAAAPVAPAPATWDPAHVGSALTLSNGNLTATYTTNTTGWASARSTRLTFPGSGKRYLEVTRTNPAGNANAMNIGLVTPDFPIGGSDFIGEAGGKSIGNNNGSGGGYIYFNAATPEVGASNPWGTSTTNPLQICIDQDRGKVWFGNGSGKWNNIAADDPVAGVGGITLGVLGVSGLYLAVSMFYGNTAPPDGVTVNFGTSAFSWPVPAGYAAYNAI
jgi:hypothetical protein